MRRRGQPWRADKKLSPTTIALAMLGAVIVVAPQLYGGVFPWSMDVIAASATLALSAAWWTTREKVTARASWLVIAMCGTAVWTVLQAVQLPCGLVARIAPAAASALRAAYAALGAQAPALCTLSRDPGATHQEIVKGAAITAGFLAAWLLAANGARRQLLWLVGLSTLVMSVVALAHAAFDMDKVFGLYQPVDTHRVILLAPLMNQNNLGGFVAMGAPIWVGIVARERDLVPRWVAATGVVLTTATALLSLSRGAIGVLLAGLGAMAALAWLRRRAASAERASSSGSAVPTLVVAVAVALGLTGYAIAERVFREFRGGDVDKLKLISAAFRFALQHPWIGVGRGAFASTFVGAQHDLARYLYPENFLAQWASEWGFPVALLLLLALGQALWSSARGSASYRRVGAIVGLLALAAQNLVDLGTEILGIAVVAAVLLGAIVAPSRHAQPPGSGSLPLAQRLAGAAAVSCGLVLLLLGPQLPRDDVSRLENVLRAQLQSGDRAAFATTLRRAVRLHPSEPVFPVLAAAENLAHHDPATPRALNRAMLLAPRWTTPHLQAYEWLWLVGHRSQALLEVRIAAEIDPRATDQVVCELARAAPDEVVLAAPLGPTPQREHVLDVAADCLSADEAKAEAIDVVILHEFPRAYRARERHAWRLAKQGQLAQGLEVLDEVLRLDPQRARAHALRAQMLLEAGLAQQAAAAAIRGLQLTHDPDRAPLVTVQARAFAALGDDAKLQGALADLRRLAESDPGRLADCYALEGELQAQRQLPGAAFRAYQEAYRIKQDSRYLQRAADLAASLGDRRQALWAYMRLCETDPGGTSYCARRDELLQALRSLNSVNRPGN